MCTSVGQVVHMHHSKQHQTSIISVFADQHHQLSTNGAIQYHNRIGNEDVGAQVSLETFASQ